jgi:O-antigen/teichoic acid export membrane protein
MNVDILHYIMTIRVIYSGLFFFIVGIITILTGLIFMLIITRTLNQQEFGTWTLITGLIFYVTLIQPITSYWITREIARKEESARTGIISSGIFSSLGILIFIIIAFFVSEQTESAKNILLFAAIIIPVSFLNQVLEAINLGFKPHVTSLGKLTLEISKIPLAIIFILYLDFGVQGVILSITFAHVPSIILLLYFAREKITGAIKQEFLIKWVKLSWIPLYPGIYSLLRTIDLLIFTLITGSVLGLAYYGAALSVSALVIHSTSISGGVYSKLLSEEKTDYLQDIITKMFYFAIPLFAISITFARPGLFALNPLYEIAVPVVIILTIKSTLIIFSREFENYLTGVERVDLNSKSTFKDYVHSRLFTIPSFRLIQNLIYLVLLVIMLTLLNSNHTEFELLVYWAVLSLFAIIPITIYLSVSVKNKFDIRLDLKPIIKYLTASAFVFIPLFILTENYLVYDDEIVKFLPNLLIFVILGIIGYVSITFVIDSKTRIFFNAIIQGVIKKSKQE